MKAFTDANWRVGFTYHKSHDNADMISKETGASAFCADVRDAEAMRAAFRYFRSVTGDPDALICNAGISEQMQFQDITDENWLDMLNTNFMGAVRAVRLALPSMLQKKKGSIVFVSSIWGEKGASCESHYAASKAALIGLMKSLALELGPSNIRVNCVAPGVIDTDMNAIHTKETLDLLAEETPLCRLGRASDAADAIFFLSSGKASFVTGEVLTVSGGYAN